MAVEFLYSLRGPKSWAMMRAYKLAEALKETDVALMPCGVIKDHAGGLPLGRTFFRSRRLHGAPFSSLQLMARRRSLALRFRLADFESPIQRQYSYQADHDDSAHQEGVRESISRWYPQHRTSACFP
jgi:hypothetical protein